MYSDSYEDPLVMLIVWGFILGISVISYVINGVLLGGLFKKVGIEQWRAWVPFYNTWIFLELGGQKGWYSLLALLSGIPFLGFVAAIAFYVFLILAAVNIGNHFNKPGAGWIILYIFLSPIWLAIVAFDKEQWYGPVPHISGRS